MIESSPERVDFRKARAELYDQLPDTRDLADVDAAVAQEKSQGKTQR